MFTDFVGKISLDFDESFVYLLIELKLESSTIDKSEKFSISTWLAIPESRTSYAHKNLRKTFELEQTYTKTEIEGKFFDLIIECNEKLEELEELEEIELNQEFEIAIEWILPNDLLSSDIDNWKYREGTAISCGCFRSVHIRSSQRLHAAYKHCRPLWQKKWQYLWNNFQQINSTHYILACQCNSQCEKDLKIVDKQRNILGINFPKDLQELENISYDFIIETGIPLALWSRYKDPNVTHINDLDNLITLQGDEVLNLQFLLQSIQNERLAASSNHPLHLGHHLCFLWENPYNYPKKRKLRFD